MHRYFDFMYITTTFLLTLSATYSDENFCILMTRILFPVDRTSATFFTIIADTPVLYAITGYTIKLPFTSSSIKTDGYLWSTTVLLLWLFYDINLAYISYYIRVLSFLFSIIEYIELITFSFFYDFVSFSL